MTWQMLISTRAYLHYHRFTVGVTISAEKLAVGTGLEPASSRFGDGGFYFQLSYPTILKSALTLGIEPRTLGVTDVLPTCLTHFQRYYIVLYYVILERLLIYLSKKRFKLC